MSCYWSFRIFPLSPNRFLLIRVKGMSWRTYQVPDNHSSQQRVWKTDHYYCPHFLQKVESFIWRRSDSMVDFQNCGAFENQTVREIFFKTVHYLVGWQKPENILGSSGAVWRIRISISQELLISTFSWMISKFGQQIYIDIKRFSHVMYKIPFKSLGWWVVVGEWVEFMPTQSNFAKRWTEICAAIVPIWAQANCFSKVANIL